MAAKRPFSLATRLSFFISLATIIAFFAFTWIMIHSVKAHFEERDVHDLRQLSTTLETVLDHADYPQARRLEIVKNIIAGYANVFICLDDGQGNILFQSPNGPDLSHMLSTPGLAMQLRDGNVISWTDPLPRAIAHDNHQMETRAWRLIMLPLGKQADGKPAYHLLMALSIDFHLHYINELKAKLISAASIISLLIIAIVLFVVYQGHKPIRQISRQIQNITSRDLDVRLDPQAVPIELERLALSFNHMLERMEDVFTRQSNFSADIAHEIRTPITNLVTQTEIALSQSRSQQELEEVLYSNLEEFSRMSRMVSDMLFLAQADNNQLIPEQRELDLAEEVHKVFEFFEAWAEEKAVALRFVGSPCRVTGDPLMLRRAISNLLSNAIRYTPAGQAVTIALSESAETVRLVVENPGTPIAAEHLPRLFDRFYRVDPSRQRKGEGSGIGLAIVKSIVSAHHGSVAAQSDLRSTRFIVVLPKQV
ncbi:TPA: Cu(+)/Ag(+) sensor histidine kinase [Klebsiella quasipneumoniae subsp. similipneumoniae]|nr:Cu(+)/Ag(+) sensor histidine kinase [Klebsiella quasipneumoniae subsp. similipneumoniae]